MAPHLETFRNWLSKQPRYVDAAFGAAYGAVYGALIGFLYHALTGSLLLPTCSVTVIPALHFAFFSVWHRLKGDQYSVPCSMLAAFVSRAIFPSVLGMYVDSIGKTLTHALTLSLSLGGLHKLTEKFFTPQVPSYMKTKRLLKNLGFDTDENNFKKGLVNDYTLPLLTDNRDPEISQEANNVVAIVSN